MAHTNSRLFRLIGLTEEYDAFVTRFKQISDSKERIKTSQMNISKTAELFNYNDATVKDILKPLVRIDLRLYQLLKKEIT